MPNYNLLTPEAAEAVEWVANRIPTVAWPAFQSEMEKAISEVITRYGMDESVRKGFNVRAIVGERK